jgi:uncharacterized protein YjiS (DUF1127 family)
MADVIPLRGAASAGRPATLFGRLGAAVAVWRQRRALAELPEHLRRDVGLSETDIARELQRPVWDVPGYWRG